MGTKLRLELTKPLAHSHLLACDVPPLISATPSSASSTSSLIPLHLPSSAHFASALRDSELRSSTSLDLRAVPSAAAVRFRTFSMATMSRHRPRPRPSASGACMSVRTAASRASVLDLKSSLMCLSRSTPPRSAKTAALVAMACFAAAVRPSRASRVTSRCLDADEPWSLRSCFGETYSPPSDANFSPPNVVSRNLAATFSG